jgi:hypothetical protein
MLLRAPADTSALFVPALAHPSVSAVPVQST